ncbi:MAG TPA: hypothetical protein VMU36_05740, partial [Spirochaetia bacterium]|nr:hypothetical protein [Spirochaetia bacterium]
MRRIPEIFLGVAMAAVVLSCATGPQRGQAQPAPQAQTIGTAGNQSPAPAPAPELDAGGEAKGGRGPTEDSLPTQEAASGDAGPSSEVPLGLPS